MRMKKKIICIVLIALLIIGAAVLIIVKQHNSGAGKNGDGTQQTADEANFDFEYSDRLCGVPAMDYTSNSSTIEVTYGDAGFARKTLGVTDNSDKRNDLTEEDHQVINGYDVTLKGKDGKYYLATWTYNSFAYTISISSSRDGADPDEMKDYIESTR